MHICSKVATWSMSYTAIMLTFYYICLCSPSSASYEVNRNVETQCHCNNICICQIRHILPYRGLSLKIKRYNPAYRGNGNFVYFRSNKCAGSAEQSHRLYLYTKSRLCNDVYRLLIPNSSIRWEVIPTRACGDVRHWGVWKLLYEWRHTSGTLLIIHDIVNSRLRIKCKVKLLFSLLTTSGRTR